MDKPSESETRPAASGSGQAAAADQHDDEARPKRHRKKKKKTTTTKREKKETYLGDPRTRVILLKNQAKVLEGSAPALVRFWTDRLDRWLDDYTAGVKLLKGKELTEFIKNMKLEKELLEKELDEIRRSQIKIPETDPTCGARGSREEAASDRHRDDKEKADLLAPKDSSSSPGKGKDKSFIDETQQEKSNIEASTQQEIRKRKKKQKKRQRHKMGGSTENLSCRGSSSSPSSSDDGTSTLAIIDGEPKPSSGTLAEIAQDHADKIAPAVTKIAQENDDKIVQDHADKIAPDVLNIKQEQESAADIQALLNMDRDIMTKNVRSYLSQLSSGTPNDYDLWPEDDSKYDESEDPLKELHERLAFYRIIGYELSKGRKLGKLEIAKLKEEYTPSILHDERYFERYEDSLEWYFNPKLCEFPASYDDYQRLELQNNILYLDWERYRTTRKTYEADLAYVRYCEVIANELKWIEDHLARGPTDAEWRRLKDITSMLALKIATSSQGIDTGAAFTASKGYLWSIQFDFHHKDFDGVYFEIWKRVAKRKMHFVDALTEVYREDMYPVRKVDIKHELDKIPLRFRTMKECYDAHVACIDETVPEDEARQLIKEAAIKMNPKPMIYLDYARKKLEIAKDIGLIIEDGD